MFWYGSSYDPRDYEIASLKRIISMQDELIEKQRKAIDNLTENNMKLAGKIFVLECSKINKLD